MATLRIDGKSNLVEVGKCFPDRWLLFLGHKEYQKPSAAGTQQLPAERSRLHCRSIDMVDRRIADARNQRALFPPSYIQQTPKIAQRPISSKQVMRFLYELVHSFEIILNLGQIL